jgi:hypothetical protein
MRLSRKPARLVSAIVGAVVLTASSALVALPAQAVPPAPESCPVAGPAPVANPSFTEGTPYPAAHNIDLANQRLIVGADGAGVMVIKQHLECVKGVVTIVDTPLDDTSVLMSRQQQGPGQEGLVRFTLGYRSNGQDMIQEIQTDEFVADGGQHTTNPVYKQRGAYKQYDTAWARPAGRQMVWVYSDVYVRVAGQPVFTTGGVSADRAAAQWPQSQRVAALRGGR